jgi:hypothetical protein
MTDLTAAADRILEEALELASARDPRDFYRDRLRALKQARPQEYDEAVAYYTDTLIPRVASGDHDPLECWTEYGRRLAAALAPGSTVAVDPTGGSCPFEAPAADRLILHMPEETGARALVVALPPTLSKAQQATYDVLVTGKHK